MTELDHRKELIDAIDGYMTDLELDYDFNTELQSFIMSVEAKIVRKLEYLIYVEDDGYMVYVNFPITPDPADERQMAQLAMLLCRINRTAKIGSFILDMETGDLCYQIYIPCPDSIPTKDAFFQTLWWPAGMCSWFTRAILSVIFNYASAKEAFAQAEDEKREQFEREGADFDEDDPDDLDFLHRLKA